MALRFPRFSQGLAQDPTTRRIWFGIATAHDFEKYFCFSLRSISNHFSVDFRKSVSYLLLMQFGILILVNRPWKLFLEGVLLVQSLHWSSFSIISFCHILNSGLVTPTTEMETERLFGVSSLAWTGHLVHVAIPASRGEYVRWNNFLDVLPHPQGFLIFFPITKPKALLFSHATCPLSLSVRWKISRWLIRSSGHVLFPHYKIGHVVSSKDPQDLYILTFLLPTRQSNSSEGMVSMAGIRTPTLKSKE
ncbi:hypothetical protein ACOSQ2_010041 [Xanthoceras sorbifolium]